MSQKCGAAARSNNYMPCKQIAMANGKCHFHGGKSTGAKTVEGKLKQKMASWKHGLYSKEAMEEKKNFREMLQKHKSALRMF